MNSYRKLINSNSIEIKSKKDSKQNNEQSSVNISVNVNVNSNYKQKWSVEMEEKNTGSPNLKNSNNLLSNQKDKRNSYKYKQMQEKQMFQQYFKKFIEKIDEKQKEVEDDKGLRMHSDSESSDEDLDNTNRKQLMTQLKKNMKRFQ